MLSHSGSWLSICDMGSSTRVCPRPTHLNEFTRMLLHSNLSLSSLQSSYCVMCPSHTCSCSLMLPNDPLFQRFLPHHVCWLNKCAEGCSKIVQKRCQRGSTRYSHDGRISCASATVSCSFPWWLEFLHYAIAMSAQQTSYVPMMI